MSLETLSVFFIAAGGLAATALPFVYAAVGDAWRNEPVGRALMTSWVGLALVLDLTLLFRVWEPAPLLGMVITVIVLGLVAVGAWLTLGALVYEWRRGRKS